jgi:predicted transcriptional regulator
MVISTQNASAYSVSGRVLDYETNRPISGASVSAYSGGTLISEDVTDAQGNFIFSLPQGNYTVTVKANGYQLVTLQVTVTHDLFLNITLNRTYPNPGKENAMGMSSSVLVLAVLLLVIVFVVLLLFFRISGRKAIEHQRRSTLLEHIKQNPGTHFREMSRTFCMKEGALTHHLSVLEREGFVRSKMFAGKRIYYLTGSAPMPKDIKETIAELVAAVPGITQSDIARELEISRMLVHYHVDRLLKEEVIFTKENGLYPRPNLEN